jgi:tetratricopeptide (TPR) repeat protein
MPTPQTHYEILQISPSASFSEIKSAFRKLARQYHPDLNPNDPRALERFRQVYAAYEILSDSDRRSSYDYSLQSPHSTATKKGPDFRDYFNQGVQQLVREQYPQAIENFNLAIRVNRAFLEAYLKRGEAYYKLGDYRQLLENCRQILAFSPNCAEAYFYQGRARDRLGYAQAAINAYGQAIEHKPNFANAYYFRGVTWQSIKQYTEARSDLERAELLFQNQKDLSGAALARDVLKRLPKQKGIKQGRTAGSQASGSASQKNQHPIAIDRILQSLIQVFANPLEGLEKAFSQLRPIEIVIVGLLMTSFTYIGYVIGVHLGWSDVIDELSILTVLFLGVVPGLTLLALLPLVRLLFKKHLKWIEDWLITCAVLVPIGFFVLVGGLIKDLGTETLNILAILGGCHASLTLYSGLTQVFKLPTLTAASLIPVLLLSSFWTSYWVYLQFA